MSYYKGNLIPSGGTEEKCCKTCCEMDRQKNKDHGYCVHEGVVGSDDICPLHLKGDWKNRIKLRLQRRKILNKQKGE